MDRACISATHVSGGASAVSTEHVLAYYRRVPPPPLKLPPSRPMHTPIRQSKPTDTSESARTSTVNRQP